jgi:Domain of unknown function (DUF4190)
VETRPRECQDREVTDPQRYATEARWSVPLAPIALALSLLVAPVGIVLGVVALRRIRRDNESGAGTAVAAIAVGTVVTIAYVVLIVLLIVLFVQLNHSTQPLPPGLSLRAG